jgi:hypothetical protein
LISAPCIAQSTIAALDFGDLPKTFRDILDNGVAYCYIL